MESEVNGQYSNYYDFCFCDCCMECGKPKSELAQEWTARKQPKRSKGQSYHAPCYSQSEVVNYSPSLLKCCDNEAVDTILDLHDKYLDLMERNVRKTQSSTPLVPCYCQSSASHRRSRKERPVTRLKNRTNRRDDSVSIAPQPEAPEDSDSTAPEEYAPDCQLQKPGSKYRSQTVRQYDSKHLQYSGDSRDGNIREKTENHVRIKTQNPISDPSQLDINGAASAMDLRHSIQRAESNSMMGREDSRKDTHCEVIIKEKSPERKSISIRKSIYAGGDHDLENTKKHILCLIDCALNSDFSIAHDSHKQAPRQQEIRIQITQAPQKDECQALPHNVRHQREFSDCARRLKSLRQECLNQIQDEIKELCRIEKLDISSPTRRSLPTLQSRPNSSKQQERQEKEEEEEEENQESIAEPSN